MLRLDKIINLDTYTKLLLQYLMNFIKVEFSKI
jgi:hypothetical protein